MFVVRISKTGKLRARGRKKNCSNRQNFYRAIFKKFFHKKSENLKIFIQQKKFVKKKIYC